MGMNHLRVLSQMPGVELCGLIEIEETRAQACSEQFGIPAWQEYRRLFGKVDAVSIVVPSSMHYDIARDFLKHNVHVLVEKPITVDQAQARRLIELAKSRNLVLQVGHLERFNPAMTELRKRIGKPLYLQACRMGLRTTRNLDVGVIWDLMIHDLDIMLNLVKSPIVDISGVGQSVYSAHEDFASVRLTFKNGCVANLVASRISGHRARTLTVMEADRNYHLDFMNQTLTVHEAAAAQPQAIPVEKAEPLRLELEDFVDCVRTQREPEVTGLDGKRALELAIQAGNRMRMVGEPDALIAMAG
jgi:predicted dehydrogenase